MDTPGDLGLSRRPPTTLMARELAPQRDARPRRGARDAAPGSDAGQRWRAASRACSASLARAPQPGPGASDRQLGVLGRRHRQQHDLRAPPLPRAVALGLVRDHARSLQIVQPPLHAAPVPADERRPRSTLARDRAPADHRRQPHDQLPDRRRVPSRLGRVPEPEQVSLDRVRPRLEPIVTGRRAPALAASAPQQRHDDEPARLSRQRLDRRAIPATRARRRRRKLQRHRQRPKAPRQQEALRARADARGTAGSGPNHQRRAARGARRRNPSKRGWRSVRRPGTVGEGIY